MFKVFTLSKISEHSLLIRVYVISSLMIGSKRNAQIFFSRDLFAILCRACNCEEVKYSCKLKPLSIRRENEARKERVSDKKDARKIDRENDRKRDMR